MPSDSEEDETVIRHSPGFIFFDRILQELILGSQAKDHGVTNVTVNNDSSSSGRENTHLRSTGLPLSSRPQLDKGKRRQREDDSDSEHGEERRRPPSKKSNLQALDSTGRPRFIACPFMKLDPRKHKDCFSKKITNIGYVKQHLTRTHTPSLYCPRCFLIFDDEDLYEHHNSMIDACTRNPLKRLEGISLAQRSRLSQKSTGSIESQWYAIWDILFPGQRQPSSIYVLCGQSQELALIREVAQRNGADIMRDQFRAILRPGVSDAQLDETLVQAVDRLIAYYCSSPGSSPETLSVPPSDPGGSNQPSDSGGSRNAPFPSRASQVGERELKLRVQVNSLEYEIPVYEDNNTDDGARGGLGNDLDSLFDSICHDPEGLLELGGDLTLTTTTSYPFPS